MDRAYGDMVRVSLKLRTMRWRDETDDGSDRVVNCALQAMGCFALRLDGDIEDNIERRSISGDVSRVFRVC